MADPDDREEREARLVAAWRAGDVGAFAEIARIYRRRLFATALRHTNGAASAEDAVQIALHNAYRGIAKVNGTLELGPWLMEIVRNAAINESRREMRNARNVRRAADAAADDPRVAEGEERPRSSLDRLERLELGRILHEGLAALPVMYRRPLELFHVQGLPVNEVARTLGLNPATVRTHLARGRALLHRRLERRLREGGYA